jgi:hypothetical protein
MKTTAAVSSSNSITMLNNRWNFQHFAQLFLKVFNKGRAVCSFCEVGIYSLFLTFKIFCDLAVLLVNNNFNLLTYET